MNEKTYLKKVLIFIILFSISFIPSTTIITEDGSFTTGAEVWQYNINESNKTIIYEEKKIQKDYLCWIILGLIIFLIIIILIIFIILEKEEKKKKENI